MRSSLLLSLSFGSVCFVLLLSACNSRDRRPIFDGSVVMLDGSTPSTDGSAGTDSGPPVMCDGDACPTGSRCVDGFCVPDAPPDAGVRDAGGADAAVGAGQCLPSCLAASGAMCCRECGCGGASVRCEPVCPAPYTWDCELTCCFNYETFECLE